ncbi:MAG: hypothetical protein GF370_03280 [Candidatus Nealsonbacteria bacterium]|nr:hypothetical protein [Candidatus Nealsonbacteria bacterium]
MEYSFSKEEAEQFMSLPGQIRGGIIKADGDFILKKKGRQGLRRLEERMKELDQPLRFSQIQMTKFYPVGLKAVVLLSIKDVFGFEKEDFIELGRFASKSLSILRFFMRYLLSLERVAKEISQIWDKNYSVGECAVTEFNKKEGYMKIRISDFKLHPAWCHVHLGYLPATLQIIAQKKVACQELKCVHQGDECHEFLLSWQGGDE